ncbi:MAG: hypothetical protein IJR86_07105, partial [Bacteroidaceae bacterium]|nr:hypothetical protein [Bacteroidaceae bacterium]
MKKSILSAALLALLATTASAQEQQNDATAPLHLMTPAYKYAYGVPKAEDVKATMDRVKNYLEANTYTELDESGKML